jgi:hypothetical protein
MDSFREALILYLDKLRNEYATLRAREQADIDDAVRTHSSIAESAWKHRHRVECRIRSAVGLLEALS